MIEMFMLFIIYVLFCVVLFIVSKKDRECQLVPLYCGVPVVLFMFLYIAIGIYFGIENNPLFILSCFVVFLIKGTLWNKFLIKYAM